MHSLMTYDYDVQLASYLRRQPAQQVAVTEVHYDNCRELGIPSVHDLRTYIHMRTVLCVRVRKSTTLFGNAEALACSLQPLYESTFESTFLASYARSKVATSSQLASQLVQLPTKVVQKCTLMRCTEVRKYLGTSSTMYFQVLSYNVVRIDICFSQDRAPWPQPVLALHLGLLQGYEITPTNFSVGLCMMHSCNRRGALSENRMTPCKPRTLLVSAKF